MMPRRSMAAWLLLACAAAVAVPAQGQVRATHEVRRGDTLFAIAGKNRHEGVSRNQMLLAIWRANQGAFPGGNINVLEIGTILTIPSREAVAAIESAEADREVRELLASKPISAAQVAMARPDMSTATVASPARERAMRRYNDGLALEHKGDDQGALQAFLEAGEGGHGLAQRKLGQIYDKGNSAVRRDLQTSIFWYQKAREQGVPIDRPLPRVAPNLGSN